MIDLHSHSTASDGTDSPVELARKAHAQGIKALALTDHDSLDGLGEAESCAWDLSMDFIRGCELSSRTLDDKGKERKLHILGLWIPQECAELEKFLLDARERRDMRNLEIIDRLHDRGIEIKPGELREIASGAIGRPHFAQLLLDKGHVNSINEAFQEYLGYGGKAYVPKKSVSPEKAISVLSRQGAMVFIAHPLLGIRTEDYKDYMAWLRRNLPFWKSLGLCGLEAWHSAHGRKQTDSIIRLAAEHDLEISGGSDYHGTRKENIRLGHACDNQPIPDSIYSKLKEYRKANSYPD